MTDTSRRTLLLRLPAAVACEIRMALPWRAKELGRTMAQYQEHVPQRLPELRIECLAFLQACAELGGDHFRRRMVRQLRQTMGLGSGAP